MRPSPGVPCPLVVMTSQEGVIEVGGNNRGKEVELYLSSVSLGPGYAWCAACVHWSYRECGKVLEPARSFAMALNWHPASRRVWTKEGWEYDDAKAWVRISEDGDHFALYYSNLGRIGHTGMITGETEDYILTIEGNTSSGGSREGDGVYARKRLKKSLYCISRW